MTDTLRKFCGETVDADALVSKDTGKLRESISAQGNDRPAKSSPSRLRMEQD